MYKALSVGASDDLSTSFSLINPELVLSDLGTVEKLYQKASKSSKSGEKEGLLLKNLLEKKKNLKNKKN